MWAALDDLAVIVTSVPVIVAFMFSVGISAAMIIVMVRLGLAPPIIIPPFYGHRVPSPSTLLLRPDAIAVTLLSLPYGAPPLLHLFCPCILTRPFL